jgi:hypothetical protein
LQPVADSTQTPSPDKSVGSARVKSESSSDSGTQQPEKAASNQA